MGFSPKISRICFIFVGGGKLVAEILFRVGIWYGESLKIWELVLGLLFLFSVCLDFSIIFKVCSVIKDLIGILLTYSCSQLLF